MKVGDKLGREALAQHLDGRRHLLLADLLVLLLLRRRLQALPRQRSAQEVHQDVPEGFEVVASALLDAEVGVDGRVPGRAREVLVLPVRYVLVRLGIAVLLGEAKVDDVHLVGALAEAHEEVIGLDVAVDERLGVHVLDPRHELIGEHEHRLQRQLAVAKVEQVLQRRA